MTKWKHVPAGAVLQLDKEPASWKRPPKLTDERIKEMSDMYMNMYGFDDVAFARAIEREILGGWE